MKRISAKQLVPGTLIAIPANSRQFLVGQILIEQITFFMQVHSLVVDEIGDVLEALKSPILLFGETTNGDLGRDIWKFCGKTECPNNFYRPYYVVHSSNGLVLKDFDGEFIREATDEDFQMYGYRKSVSSPVFTSAVKNFIDHGFDFDFGAIDARRVARRCELQFL